MKDRCDSLESTASLRRRACPRPSFEVLESRLLLSGTAPTLADLGTSPAPWVVEVTQTPLSASQQRRAELMRSAYDAGDFRWYQNQQLLLLRVPGEYVLTIQEGEEAIVSTALAELAGNGIESPFVLPTGPDGGRTTSSDSVAAPKEADHA